MKAEDVTTTLGVALQASGLEQAKLVDRLRLSDNGSSYIAGDLAKWLADRNIKHLRGLSSNDPGQDRALKNRILLSAFRGNALRAPE